MLTKIDWISFSVPFQPLPIGQAHRLLERVGETLGSLYPFAYDVLLSCFQFEQRKGRAPYNVGFERADKGVYIFAHPALTHFLIEITGHGCTEIADNPLLNDFIAEITPRLTRMDIATDILTETNPIEFAQQRDTGRFRSHSEFVSESGTTAYVGSRTSNRYARVYRYNEPHERAKLLRVETVVKSQDAQNTARALLQNGVDSVAKSLGEQFGWYHPDWKPETTSAAEIEVYRPERKEGKTMFWLNDTVAKTLVRLSKEKGFDPQKWLNEFVLSQL